MACLVGKNKSSDTMSNISEIEKDMAEYSVLDTNVNIDDIGIGRGVSDRMKEKGHAVNAVNVGESAVMSPENFANLKAELCWEARKWIINYNGPKVAITVLR